MSARPDPPGDLHSYIEKALRYHIETSYEAGIPAETLKEQMQILNDPECLVSEETCKWALKEVDAICKQDRSSSRCMAISPMRSPKANLPIPSPSPSILYHALLCCTAVNTASSTRALHDFFSKIGHQLQEASLSPQSNNINQYMMAKNGDTFYLAFQSEPSIARWLSCHNTFEEGTAISYDRLHDHS